MIFVLCWIKMQGDHLFFKVVADLNLFSLDYCFGLGFCLILGLALAGTEGFSGTFGYCFGATSCLIGGATSSLWSFDFSFSGR